MRLALEGVCLRVGTAVVLEDVSLVVGRELVGLIGPSGGGKTSLLRVLLGLVTPQRGTVRIGDRPVSAAGKVLCRPVDRGLAMVFQDLALWPHLTVHGNLAFALEGRPIVRGEREDRIRTMLARVGLSQAARRHPDELSGGERQRVAIARALVVAPQAVLLDEPLSNLDVVLKDELLALFRELLGQDRTPAVYVTHDPVEAGRLCDRVAVLERGRIVQAGTFAELRAAPGSAFVGHFVEAASAPGA